MTTETKSLNDFVRQAVEHLRGLPERTKGIPDYSPGAPRPAVLHAKTIPNSVRAALTVLGRECPCILMPSMYGDECDGCLNYSGHGHSPDCYRCKGTGVIPIDVSWMDAPQYQSTREGFLRDAARACGWLLVVYEDLYGNVTLVELRTQAGTLIDSEDIGNAETVLEAMTYLLSRAWGMDG